MEKKNKGQKVEALTKNDIEKILFFLNKNKKYVMLGIFTLGIHTGLRISDYINSNFEDIQNNNLIIKNSKKILLNNYCLETIEILKKYYKEKNMIPYDKGPIFRSTTTNLSITYRTVARYIKQIEKKLNIPYPIGSDSFKKTYLQLKLTKEQKLQKLKDYLANVDEETLKLYLNKTKQEIENWKVIE
ncbi:MAG: tyrosine-type recombinase/integrase [Cetobacterium sp.]|uniref:tyrosine-type recombinase/integrase n=1 Tax=Cetobacterium sp. TaxID=2071632 RepID=UPI003F3CA15B